MEDGLTTPSPNHKAGNPTVPYFSHAVLDCSVGMLGHVSCLQPVRANDSFKKQNPQEPAWYHTAISLLLPSCQNLPPSPLFVPPLDRHLVVIESTVL